MLQEFADIRQASIAAVEHIVNVAKSAVLEKGLCTIVLAGGSTPQQAYELLSEPENTEQMPWQQSHFFWGDERWVASTHPDSNFFMAQKNLLSRVHVPPQNIHQIIIGDKGPAVGARQGERAHQRRGNAQPTPGVRRGGHLVAAGPEAGSGLESCVVQPGLLIARTGQVRGGTQGL